MQCLSRRLHPAHTALHCTVLYCTVAMFPEEICSPQVQVGEKERQVGRCSQADDASTATVTCNEPANNLGHNEAVVAQ